MFSVFCQYEAELIKRGKGKSSWRINIRARTKAVPGYKNWKYIHQRSFWGRKEANFNWVRANHKSTSYLSGRAYNWPRLHHGLTSDSATIKPFEKRQNNYFHHPSTIFWTFLWIWPIDASGGWKVHIFRSCSRILRPFFCDGLYLPWAHECVGVLFRFDESSGGGRRPGKIFIKESCAWLNNIKNGKLFQAIQV